VQAPKVRKKERRERARPSGLLLAFAGAGIVALAAVIVGIVALRGGSEGRPTALEVTAALQAAGCTSMNKAPLPFLPNHRSVPTPTTPVRWNTFPPAAGAHYQAPLVWNFYDEPLNPRQAVHNEEHGGVVLWWGPKTPSSTVDELRQFYLKSPDAMVGMPLAAKNPGITFVGVENPSLGRKVAITAWTIDNPLKYFKNGDLGVGHAAVCPTFDEQAFSTFRDAYRGLGPEGIPTSANKPGT
jgi:hypothetical protein